MLPIQSRVCGAKLTPEQLKHASRARRNCNCGNLKFVGQRLAIGKDKLGFAIFKDYEDGYITLKNMILKAAKGESKIYKPTDTLYSFFSKFAPIQDNNNPENYAIKVASRLGVSPTKTLKQLFT